MPGLTYSLSIIFIFSTETKIEQNEKMFQMGSLEHIQYSNILGCNRNVIEDIISSYPENLHNLQSWLFGCLHRGAIWDRNGVLAALEG